MNRFRSAASAAVWTGVLGVLAAGASAAEDGPEIVERMIQAHGGMARWSSAPTVTFTDAWNDGPATFITVEQSGRRAYLDRAGTDASVIWDGKEAYGIQWEGPPPRFLALLNYYFVNLPWLTRDPGVRLKAEEDVAVHGKTYATVRMTFRAGVGDTPDDYYLLYIDPETHRLAGCEYIVTYAAVLPEGVPQSPAHDLLFTGYETVDGLVVPTGFTIYEKDGSVYAKCTVSNWSFQELFDESRMNVPEGAVRDDSH
jgi:hypothetical protein